MRDLFRYLFLIRFFYGIRIWQPDWSKIHNEVDMQQAYPWHFSRKNIESLPSDSPILKDWDYVRYTIFPTWMELDYHARLHGAIYYRYQWLFIFSVILTSVAAIIGLAFRNAVTAFPLAVLSICAPLIAFAALLSGNRKDIRYRWTRSNNLADTLDRAGFLFLLRIPPYADNQRAVRLSRLVAQVRGEYVALQLFPPHWQLTEPPDALENEQPSEADQKLLFDAYIRYRRDMAIGYLRSRAKMFDVNLRFTTVASLICLLLATLCATAAAALISNSFSEIVILLLLGVAIFPLGVIFFFLFRATYNWERSEKFKQSLRVLSELVDGKWLPDDYSEVVGKIETILIQAYLRDNALSSHDDTSFDDSTLRVNPVFGAPPNDEQFKCDVFMVMPFRDHLDVPYRQVIIPALESLNLRVKRGDDFRTQQPVMTDIWAAICASRMVVAECTEVNQNVYYELGIAHTLGKPTIMIAQDISNIPFDLRHLRHIIYENSDAGHIKLEMELKRTAAALLRLSVYSA
jgi:hypothetical protein